MTGFRKISRTDHGSRRQLTHQDPHLLLPKQPTEDTRERETHPASSLRLSETKTGAASAPVVDLMTIAEGLVRSPAAGAAVYYQEVSPEKETDDKLLSRGKGGYPDTIKPLYQARECSLVPLCFLTVQCL